MDSYTLLLALVIDIIYSIDGSTIIVIVSFLGILKIFSTIFSGFFQGLGLLVRVFRFVFKVDVIIFISNFNNSFVSCFNLFIDNLLAIMSCLISEI